MCLRCTEGLPCRGGASWGGLPSPQRAGARSGVGWGELEGNYSSSTEESMWDPLLKLSNSKALLVGAVVIDTLCFGTLACLVAVPAVFSLDTGVLVLSALAITAPVLGLAVAMTSMVVPEWVDAEERARRCILAGSVMHGAIQASTLLLGCCGGGPKSLAAYFGGTFALTFVVMLLMTVTTLVFKHFAKKKQRGTWPGKSQDKRED